MTDAVAPPQWIPGTREQRRLTVRGHSFYVNRSTSHTFGFDGGGRDGDVVADDAPQFAILQAVVSGIAAVRPMWGPYYAADSPEALDAVEGALLAAAGRYDSLSRETNASRAVAETMLQLTRVLGMGRHVYICGSHALTLDFAPDCDDAIAYEWAWGRDPGTWLPSTLRSLGVEPERVGGSDAGKQLRVPARARPALLSLALERFGWSDVRLIDRRP
jgi:hypothetical protein